MSAPERRKGASWTHARDGVAWYSCSTASRPYDVFRGFFRYLGSHRRDLALLIFLSVFVVFVFMGPVVWHANVWLYGTGHDAVGTVGSIRARLDAAQSGKFPALLGMPFPPEDAAAAAAPLWSSAAVALARAFSPLTAANIMVSIGFVGTTVSLFLLLRSLGVSRASAFFGAVVFGVSPIRLAESQQHIAYLDEFWFVLEGAILLRIRDRITLRPAVALGLCIALTELDNPYLGYFSGVLAAFWFVVIGIGRIRQQRWMLTRALAIQAVTSLSVLVAVVLVTQWSLLTAPRSQPQAYSNADSINHTLSELDSLSLRWWNFFLPYPENPIIGPIGHFVFMAHLGGSTETEQSTMTGYTALALAILGALYAYRREARDAAREIPVVGDGQTANADFGRYGRHSFIRLRGLAGFAMSCIGAGIIFGLPPEFLVGSITLDTPSYFVHLVLPEIRTTSRIDLIIQLGVAILSALGVEVLLLKVRSSGPRNVVLCAVTLAVLLEYTDVPPWHYVKLLPAPPVYQWLASLTSQQAAIVVQYPIASASFATTALYAFYAYDVHHHPLFNGVAAGTPSDALRRNLLDLLNPTNPASWAALGVKTVTVDTTYYAESFHNAGLAWASIFAGQLPSGLVVRHVDTQATGYAVTAPPAPLVAGLGDGFGDALLGPDGREWRWVAGTASVWLDNVTPNAVQIVLWTEGHNNVVAHSVRWPGYVPAPVGAAQRQSPLAITVTAQPGMHSFVLDSVGPQQPVEGSGNSTPEAVQLRSLEPAPVRPLKAQFVAGGTARFALTGVSTDACTVQAGASLAVALLWHVDAPTSRDETVFVHLVGPGGTLAAQADGPPDGGAVATAHAAPGSDISDVHALPLPPTLPPGPYQLQAGLYDPHSMQRLPLHGGGDAVDLGSVTVVTPSAGPKRVPCSW